MPKKDKSKSKPLKGLPSNLRSKAQNSINRSRVFLPPSELITQRDRHSMEVDAFDDEAIVELAASDALVNGAARSIEESLELNPNQNEFQVQVRVPGPDDEDRYVYMEAVRSTLPLNTTKKQPGVNDDERYEYMDTVRRELPLLTDHKEGVFMFPVTLAQSSSTDPLVFNVKITEEQLVELRRESWKASNRNSLSSEDSGVHSFSSVDDKSTSENHYYEYDVAPRELCRAGESSTDSPIYDSADFPGFSEVSELENRLRGSMAGLGFSVDIMPEEASISLESQIVAEEELYEDLEAFGYSTTDDPEPPVAPPLPPRKKGSE